MYTGAALIDMHERGHRSLRGLIRHCAELDAAELTRALPGFGYPNIRQQLAHTIGGEEYWVSVIQGRYADDPEEIEPETMEAMESYRQQVAEGTVAYLRNTSDGDLNAPREMKTWPNRLRVLVPALVVIRTIAHIYSHQGQVMAMCRILGRPGPSGLDFPLN